MAYDKTSIRTELSRVRYLGSAHSGTRAASHMRLTSLALVPLAVGFVWLLLNLLRKDYNGVRDTLGSPLPAILLLLFLGTGIYHMKLGLQAVIEDYVHDERAKAWSLAANTFFSACVGLACIYAVLRISFA